MWGRLAAPAGEKYRSVELYQQKYAFGDMVVGKGKLPQDFRMLLARDVSTGAVTLENACPHSMTINNSLLQSGEKRNIADGDVLKFGSSPDAQSYSLQLLGSKGGQTSVSEAGASSHSGVSDAEEGPAKRQKVEGGSGLGLAGDSVLDTFTCGICQEIFHDCISLAPCQHNFCNACFSGWNRTAMRRGMDVACPSCRCRVASAARNPTLRALVEAYIAEHPDCKRSSEEIADMDKRATVTSTPLVMKRSNPGSDSGGSGGSYDDDYDYDDDDDTGCAQCAHRTGALPAGAFRCQPDTRHISCSACFQPMPERTEEALLQKCAICNHAFCQLYWESQQGLPANVRCMATNPVRLTKLAEADMASMPSIAFGGNTAEQEITSQFLSGQGRSLRDVIMEGVRNIAVTTEVGKYTRGPPIVPPTPITASSLACRQCLDMVAADVIYAFRSSIPKNELPAEASSRQDCWYGRECRTQFHKSDHARRLNHACDPDPSRLRSTTQTARRR